MKYRNPGTSAENGLRRRRLAEASLFCTPSFNNAVVDNAVVDNKEPNRQSAPESPISSEVLSNITVPFSFEALAAQSEVAKLVQVSLNKLRFVRSSCRW